MPLGMALAGAGCALYGNLVPRSATLARAEAKMAPDDRFGL